MSCTVVYPLLLLIFSCVCLSDVQPEENTVLTEKTELLKVEENTAALTSGDFQKYVLTGIYTELAELRSTIRSLKEQLEVTKEQLEQLRRNDYKVAFAATLGSIEHLGPFNTEITLTYQRVFVNEGGAYNPATGIFAAPVKGVYFITISGLYRTTTAMDIRLFKNTQQMITVINYASGDRFEGASNSMSLTLEKGDHVYVRLWRNSWVFDNVNAHTTFVCHLLFSL